MKSMYKPRNKDDNYLLSESVVLDDAKELLINSMNVKYAAGSNSCSGSCGRSSRCGIALKLKDK